MSYFHNYFNTIVNGLICYLYDEFSEKNSLTDKFPSLSFVRDFPRPQIVPGRYLDFGIDSIPSTRQTALIVLYANNYVLAVVDQTRMKPACLTSKRKYFREKN